VHSRTYKLIFVILLVSFISTLNIYSIDYDIDNTGFVVDSPLYFSTDESLLEEINYNFQSFNEQLGVFEPDTNILNREYDLLKAISTPHYSITPGDTFQVDYLEGNKTKQLILIVDSDYKLNIPSIGEINAENKNLVEIKELIKSNISKYYSFSSPQVSFIALGIFSVDVIGEVISSTRFTVNSLTRLSDVVYVANDRASTRDVLIKDRYGKIHHYDLYLALKEGDLNNNPELKAGDTVILTKAEKTINVVGSVYKQGTFQVNESDTFEEIIEKYCDGLLPKADKDGLYIRRYDEKSNSFIEQNTNSIKNISILNLDTIVVPEVEIKKESVFIEGALSNSTITNQTAYSPLSSAENKIIYNFYPNETLEDMLETISVRFVANSDLLHAYLIRGDEKISINILNYLTTEVNDKLYLKAGDKIIIPYDNKYVNVQGAVENSGTFVYQENETLDYYISLAGGYSSDATDTITITDSKGNKIDKDENIPYDSTIYIKRNTFKSDVATTASIVAIIASIASIISTAIGLF